MSKLGNAAQPKVLASIVGHGGGPVDYSFFYHFSQIKLQNVSENLGLHVSVFKPARFYILVMTITNASLSSICTF